ncbi:MAG: hypothetical protein ACOCQS_00170 [Bacillota bacterium]
MSVSYIWLYLTAVISILTLFLVPFDKIKELFGFSLIGGFLLAVVVQLAGISLGWWSFNSGFLIFYNFPLGVAFMWLPAVITFAYFFNKTGTLTGKIMIIFIWSFITSLITYASVEFGYRNYIDWNIYYDFILAIFLHSVLGYYLFIKRKREV